MESPLTPRDRQIARRNYIVFCGLATVIVVLSIVVATIVING